MKKIISLFVLAVGLIAVVACAPAKSNLSQEEEMAPGYVPQEWLLESGKSSEKFATKGSMRNLEISVDALLKSQLDALGDLKENTNREVFNKEKPQDWVPWRMVALISELGISSSGLLGSLTAKGTPSVQVFWEKKKTKNINPADHEVVEPSTLSINSDMSESELTQELEPMIQGLMASGRVFSESALRKSLLQTVLDFQSLMNQVDESKKMAWTLSRFRVDVTVGATGLVSLGSTAVGLEAKLRLEWYKTHKQKGAQPATSTKTFGDIKGFAQFINDLSYDLTKVSTNAADLLGGNYLLEEFQIGLGASAKGDVGIAKGKVRALGIAYFVPQTPQRGLSLQAPGQAQLQKGLIKAMKIGRFFAERASGQESSQWAISKIKPGFDMTLGGDVGLVSVTGDLVTQLVFKNTHF